MVSLHYSSFHVILYLTNDTSCSLPQFLELPRCGPPCPPVPLKFSTFYSWLSPPPLHSNHSSAIWRAKTRLNGTAHWLNAFVQYIKVGWSVVGCVWVRCPPAGKHGQRKASVLGDLRNVELDNSQKNRGANWHQRVNMVRLTLWLQRTLLESIN